MKNITSLIVFLAMLSMGMVGCKTVEPDKPHIEPMKNLTHIETKNRYMLSSELDQKNKYNIAVVNIVLPKGKSTIVAAELTFGSFKPRDNGKVYIQAETVTLRYESIQNLVKALAKSGKPIVLVLNGGRPRIINDIEPLAQAVVNIILPGNYGGDALAALISGRENFSGKLPYTYPKFINMLSTYDYKVSEVSATMEGVYNYDARIDVLWPFGHGLSYTTFQYEDLKVNKKNFTSEDILEFEVRVTNTGKVTGKEAVLLYSSDLFASLVPDSRRLRAFEKVELKPGESKLVKFEVPATEFAFVNYDEKWTLEEGDFRIQVGDQVMMIHCDKSVVWNSPNL